MIGLFSDFSELIHRTKIRDLGGVFLIYNLGGCIWEEDEKGSKLNL